LRPALAGGAAITGVGPIGRAQASRVPGWLTGREADNGTATARRLAGQGVPEQLACQISGGLTSFGLLDVVEVSELAERDDTGTVERGEQQAERVAELYYTLSAHLGIDRILDSVSNLPRGNRWNALARLALRDDLYAALRGITLDVLRGGDAGVDLVTTIARWEQENASRRSRARATLEEIADAGSLDLSTLAVATRGIRSIVR